MKKVILAVLVTAFALFLVSSQPVLGAGRYLQSEVRWLPWRRWERYRGRQEDGSSGVFVPRRAEDVRRRSG